MTPFDLIGLPYRLGAIPEKHHAADCLSLSRAVLQFAGIATPAPKRDWYRRLRRGDYGVFQEELERWGDQTEARRIGVVALCESENGGLCLVPYFEDGWLNFGGSEVRWSPTGALPVVASYWRTSSS